MAEIRVRPKRRSLVWVWVVLALIVVALVAWYLTVNGFPLLHVQRTGARVAPLPRFLLWS